MKPLTYSLENQENHPSMRWTSSKVIDKKQMTEKAKKKKKKKKYRVLGEPITLLELMKKNERTNNLKGFSSLKGDHSMRPSVEKLLRFATNINTDKVWGLVKSIPKVPVELNSEIWWTVDELNERHYDDMSTISLVEGEEYGKVLRSAFVSAKRTCPQIELDNDTMSSFAVTRGLEAEIVPEAKDFAQMHCQAVLRAQEVLLSGDKQDTDGCDLGGSSGGIIDRIGLRDLSNNLIQAQSMQFSRQSQRIALKMAELDRECVDNQDLQSPCDFI